MLKLKTQTPREICMAPLTLTGTDDKESQKGLLLQEQTEAALGREDAPFSGRWVATPVQMCQHDNIRI